MKTKRQRGESKNILRIRTFYKNKLRSKGIKNYMKA